MKYEYTAISTNETPAAKRPELQHLIDTYVSESNKTASLWQAVPADNLDFAPHAKVNSIRTILKHQLLSERRFFAEFVGIDEPDANDILPLSDRAPIEDYVDRYVTCVKLRLPQLACGDWKWWMEERAFFGFERQRIWTFWRRVLHTCHHRTQIQTWLRLAAQPSRRSMDHQVTFRGKVRLQPTPQPNLNSER